jgi:hypothetical protein
MNAEPTEKLADELVLKKNLNWKWEEQQNRPHYHKPEGDTGFTVHGKPAEAVLARWCAKH